MNSAAKITLTIAAILILLSIFMLVTLIDRINYLEKEKALLFAENNKMIFDIKKQDAKLKSLNDEYKNLSADIYHATKQCMAISSVRACTEQFSVCEALIDIMGNNGISAQKKDK